MVKKILAPIFALIILIPVFACTRQGKDPGGLTTGKTANEGSYVADYLPGETFDGKEFRVGVFSGNRFVFTQEEADNIYN